MANTGRYLYGLIGLQDHTEKGAEATTGDEPAIEFGAIGLEVDGKPGRVFVLRAGDVGAVVSEFPVKEKLLPLRRHLEPHNRVIRHVMESHTIIPMAFGHVAKNEAELQKRLKKNRKDILTELKRLDDKVEMTLRVGWDVTNIFDYFVRHNSELAAYRDQVFGKPAGPDREEKIELGRMFEQRLAAERERNFERVAEAFKPVVAEVKSNPPKSEKMVMDAAFLVERKQVKRFEEMVYLVAGQYPGEYTFDFNGPWAPFNFVQLDLAAA